MDNSVGNKCTSGEYKLTYFDVRWEAEQIRLMFICKEIPFEDVRLPLKLGEDEWPIATELGDQIPVDVQQKLAFGVLPLLELRDGETVISGGRASARFVARKLGFLGQSELEEAKIDEILDGSQEFSAAFRNIQLATTKEGKEEAGKNVVLVVTPKYMRYFNKIIEENPSPNGYMVGDQLTLADLHVFNLVTLPDGKPHPIVTDDCSGLKNLVLKIAKIPQLQKWLKDRPQSSF